MLCSSHGVMRGLSPSAAALARLYRTSARISLERPTQTYMNCQSKIQKLSGDPSPRKGWHGPNLSIKWRTVICLAGKSTGFLEGNWMSRVSRTFSLLISYSTSQYAWNNISFYLNVMSVFYLNWDDNCLHFPLLCICTKHNFLVNSKRSSNFLLQWLAVNCLDVHVAKDPDRVALIWEKDEPGTEERITYRYICSWEIHMWPYHSLFYFSSNFSSNIYIYFSFISRIENNASYWEHCTLLFQWNWEQMTHFCYWIMFTSRAVCSMLISPSFSFWLKLF